MSRRQSIMAKSTHVILPEVGTYVGNGRMALHHRKSCQMQRSHTHYRLLSMLYPWDWTMNLDLTGGYCIS